MFNLLIALISGVLIGWNFHSFYLQLSPPAILKNDINISKISQKDISNKPIPKIEKTPQPVKVVSKVISNEPTKKIVFKEENISKPKIPITEDFYTCLENNLFSDAMAFYVDAKEPQLSLYHATLLKYFEEKIKTDPQTAIEQMLEVHELHELEPDSGKVNEEQFHNIEYNENQQDQANLLLKLLKKNTHEKQGYSHKVSLQKVGEHFTLEVQVNGNPLTLLLDTGATLTMVNEAKLTSLKTIKEYVVLNTAGGEINAKLQEADSFSVGDIELKKFQIVSSSFEQKNADGLLGMNFFKEFEFKIDQENSFLYLSEKEG